MALPQSGVLAEANSHGLFLTLRFEAADETVCRRIRDACRKVPALTRELAGDDSDARLTSVVAFGSGGWDQLFPGSRPADLRPFKVREQGARKAPGTPADLLLHIRSERRDLNHELARRVRAHLGEAVALVEEVAGFRYLDSRDLTGFVDGTENPEGDDRAEVALLADGGGFDGGSYIHMQRYVHDMKRWEKLSVAKQEGIVGRSKPDDVELSGDAKPPTAHISRVVIKEDGNELEILRHSMPYGNSEESGLLFIAYGGSPEPFDRMLDAMTYADGEGHYDHLLNYTRAVTGCAFFAPSLEFLEAIDVG